LQPKAVAGVGDGAGSDEGYGAAGPGDEEEIVARANALLRPDS